MLRQQIKASVSQALSILDRRHLKTRFISMVRPTVHINPSQKQSFSKTLFKLEESENVGFAF